MKFPLDGLIAKYSDSNDLNKAGQMSAYLKNQYRFLGILQLQEEMNWIRNTLKNLESQIKMSFIQWSGIFIHWIIENIITWQ